MWSRTIEGPYAGAAGQTPSAQRTEECLAEARPSWPGRPPHLVRLFSRDAGRGQHSSKTQGPRNQAQTPDHPGGQRETLRAVDAMWRPRRNLLQRSKYLWPRDLTMVTPGRLPPQTQRDTGILDSLGRFFGRTGCAERGSGQGELRGRAAAQASRGSEWGGKGTAGGLSPRRSVSLEMLTSPWVSASEVPTLLPRSPGMQLERGLG